MATNRAMLKNAGYPTKLGYSTYVCSYDYVQEFLGTIQDDTTETYDPKGPDIYNYPPNTPAGTE